MGTPNYPEDFGTGWGALRRKVTDSFTSANTRKALTQIRTSVLSLFGDMVIKATGRLVVEHLGGTNALEVGRHFAGGQNVSGIVMNRPDGSLAFWCFGDQAGNGFWSLWDRAGHIVASDDSHSGTGLARPYLPWAALPTRWFFTPSESTTSATPTALWTLAGRVQHPKIAVWLTVQTDAGTTGQIRLRDPATGTIIAGPEAVAGNTFEYRSLVGVAPSPWDDVAQYDLEAWRTAGTGPIRVQVVHAYGVQSDI